MNSIDRNFVLAYFITLFILFLGLSFLEKTYITSEQSAKTTVNEVFNKIALDDFHSVKTSF